MQSHPNIWVPDPVFAIGLEGQDHQTHTIFRLFQIGKINSFRLVVLLSTNAYVSEKYPLSSLLPVFFHVRLWFAVIQKRRFSWGVKLIPAAFDTDLHSSWNPFPFRLWTQFYDRCLQVVNFSCFSDLIISSQVEYPLITIRLSVILWSPQVYVWLHFKKDWSWNTEQHRYHRIFSFMVDNQILN